MIKNFSTFYLILCVHTIALSDIFYGTIKIKDAYTKNPLTWGWNSTEIQDFEVEPYDDNEIIVNVKVELQGLCINRYNQRANKFKSQIPLNLFKRNDGSFKKPGEILNLTVSISSLITREERTHIWCLTLHGNFEAVTNHWYSNFINSISPTF